MLLPLKIICFNFVIFEGSGYLCACMAQMVGKSGKVIGIDHLQGLVDLSQQNILKKDKYLLDDGRVKLLFGDGWDGYADGKYSGCQLKTAKTIEKIY
jgi:protein-L-isoaspartate(D-aspartate) O-methyltransferase